MLATQTPVAAALSSRPRVLGPGEEKHRWPHGAAVKAIAFCPWREGLVATGGGLKTLQGPPVEQLKVSRVTLPERGVIQVHLVNDGPVTLLLESPPAASPAPER